MTFWECIDDICTIITLGHGSNGGKDDMLDDEAEEATTEIVEEVQILDGKKEFKRHEAIAEARHWREQLHNFEALKDIYSAEMADIYAARAEAEKLNALIDDPQAYFELSAELSGKTKKDYSPRYEAALQRKIITITNQIHNAQKRIAKAEYIATTI